MPVEQRVVSKQKIGARPGAPAEPVAPAAPAKAPTGRRKTVLVVAVVVALLVVAGAVAWYLLGRGATGAEPAPEPAPEPGAVVQVEPVSINLADGHYLRLGLALQLTADAGAHSPFDASRALDLAITLYSGRPVAEVSDAQTRDALKAELREQLAEAYDGEVMDVFLTNYVTQ